MVLPLPVIVHQSEPIDIKARAMNIINMPANLSTRQHIATMRHEIERERECRATPFTLDEQDVLEMLHGYAGQIKQASPQLCMRCSATGTATLYSPHYGYFEGRCPCCDGSGISDYD